MRSGWWCFCLFLGFFGCTTESLIRKSSAPDRSYDVAVQISALESGQNAWQPLWPHDTLHSGDQIALVVEAKQPLYIYIARAPATGPIQSLFSNETKEQAKPGSPLHIPDGGGELSLSKENGPEDLRIVASVRPLNSVEFLELAAGYRVAGTREPPPVATDGRRGPYTTYGRLGDANAAIMRFLFHHQ